MTRFFIVGASGDDALWLIDTTEKTVRQLDRLGSNGAGAAEAETVAALSAMHDNGLTVSRGVSIAIAADDRAALNSEEVLTSHQVFASHQVWTNSPS